MTPIASELQEFERGLSSYKFDSIESLDDQLTNDSIALLGRLQQHLIKIELQELARRGDLPTRFLRPAWRERMEDAVWALFNNPEMILVP